MDFLYSVLWSDSWTGKGVRCIAFKNFSLRSITRSERELHHYFKMAAILDFSENNQNRSKGNQNEKYENDTKM